MQSFQPKMTGDGGLCRFNGTSFTQFPQVKGLSKNDIYTIYETQSGQIWIGATGVGAYMYDGESFLLFEQTDRPHWTRNFGLQCVLEDRDGTTWFGFSGGLFRFNGKSFYHISPAGPWTGLYTAMASAISGLEVHHEILPTEIQTAFSALANNKLETSKEIFSRVREDSPKATAIQEFALNQFGYNLLFADRLDEAIKVFRLNTMLYPNVANTYDSLGESLLRNGDYVGAESNYRKALKLDPKNDTTRQTLNEILARAKFKDSLVAPVGWAEEVISMPPNFAPSMSLAGMEHLRLPPKFRDIESEWFCSYLFAIELSEAQTINAKFISEQLQLYYRGLAAGGRNKAGVMIDGSNFSIDEIESNVGSEHASFDYVLNWQEPFFNATPQKLNIKVKFIRGKNEHGILFVCGSPSSFESETWKELLRIRSNFENASMNSD
jgi:tetratricopeptide (TPR) repeat protein